MSLHLELSVMSAAAVMCPSSAPTGPGPPSNVPPSTSPKPAGVPAHPFLRLLNKEKDSKGTSRSSLQRYNLSQCVIKQIRPK